VLWFSWTGVLGCGGLYTVFCGYTEAQKRPEYPKEEAEGKRIRCTHFSLQELCISSTFG